MIWYLIWYLTLTLNTVFAMTAQHGDAQDKVCQNVTTEKGDDNHPGRLLYD